MASYDPRDKDHVFYRHVLGSSGEKALRRLGEFMAIHVPHRDAWERELLRDLERAVSASKLKTRMVTTPTKWKLENLLHDRKDFHGETVKALRKPKIVVDMDITSKDNLIVRWRPHPESNDFTFTEWELRPQPPHRPVNELFFARGFGQTIADAGEHEDDKDAEWWQALQLRVGEATLMCVKDLLNELGEHCDVTLDSRIVTENDPETGLITSWHFEDLEMIEERERAKREAAAEESRIAREAAERTRINQIQAVIDGAETTYGIPAPRLIGLIDAIREQKLDFPTTLKTMEAKFGMKPADPDINHVGNTRSIRRAMRELGIEPESVTLQKEDIEKPRAASISATASGATRKTETLSDRMKRRIVAHKASTPSIPARSGTDGAPDYSRIRPYAASQEELDRAGASSVHDLVVTFNEAARGTIWSPVSQADYPTSKAKFDRLAERMEKVTGMAVTAGGSMSR